MLLTNSEPTQRFDTFMESEASESFKKSDYDTIKYLLRCLIVIRLPLFMLVAKNPCLAKVMHGFETLILMLEQALPQRSVMEDPGSANIIWMLTTISNFALFYCNCRVSFIMCALSQIELQISLEYVYQRDSYSIDKHVVACLVYLCWLVVTLALMNYICVQIGIELMTLTKVD